MRSTYLRGMGLGLTTGVITTLGVMVGLYSGTHSKLAVVGGVIALAVADGLSDAIGMHISEEAARTSTKRQIWEATFFAFSSKCAATLSVRSPIILLELREAIPISIVWGLILISLFSYYIAKNEGENPYKVILEHALLTVGVVAASHYVGVLVDEVFGEHPI